MIITCIGSCQMFDITKAESKKVVGNIYVVNLHLPEDSGNFIVFRKKGKLDQYLLRSDEYIDYIKANDSIILIKTKINPVIAYYKILHKNGDSIISVNKLTKSDFIGYENIINIKYRFMSE